MYQKERAGFTLLELLIVVLIIGVLAAVALPQYKLTVCKAHMAQVETVNRQIYDAHRAYILANGKAAENFDDLGFSLPGYVKKTDTVGAEYLSNGDYSFHLHPGDGVPRIEGQYNGVCKAVLYTYRSATAHKPWPGHCISYDDAAYKYCLSRWPGSSCRQGTPAHQKICTIKS